MNLLNKFTFLFVLLMTASLAFGSGGYSGGGFSSGSQNLPQRQTDPLYEHGKAVFKGRTTNTKGVDFCLTSSQSEEGFTKIKRKSIRPFKGTSYQLMAEGLVDCNKPESSLIQTLTRDEMLTLIYYLDKRYKLNLS